VGGIHLAETQDGLEHPRKGQNHAADRNGADEALGKPAAEDAVDNEACQREYGYEPQSHWGLKSGG